MNFPYYFKIDNLCQSYTAQKCTKIYQQDKNNVFKNQYSFATDFYFCKKETNSVA